MAKNKDETDIIWLCLRYLIIVLLGLGNFWLFYKVFTPLTLYPSYLLFKIFFNTQVFQNIIAIGSVNIELIGACIAGSAYFLLTALNLTTPIKSFRKRILSLLFSYLALLIINIIRIFLMGIIFIFLPAAFSSIHLIFFYALSIIFVFLIWISEIRIFKIAKIPVYSDIKFLFRLSSFRTK